MEDFYQNHLDNVKSELEKWTFDVKEKYRQQVNEYKESIIEDVLNNYKIRCQKEINNYINSTKYLKTKLIWLPKSSQDLHLSHNRKYLERGLASIKEQTEAVIIAVFYS